MPRSDCEIFFSPQSPPSGVEAHIVGASIKGEASAPSAWQTSNPIDVAITGAAIAGKGGTVFTSELKLLTIPGILINVGQTSDMSQYIVDTFEGGRITDSQILALNTSIATYSHATKLLTGVAVGTMTGLQLEITYT